MSYILEALRKSERQRRANEDPPAARLAAEPPRPSTRRRALMIGLSVFANLALLLYVALVVYPRREPDSQTLGGVDTKPTDERAHPPRAPAAELSNQSTPVAEPTALEANREMPPTKARTSAASSSVKAVSPPRARKEPLRTPPNATVGSLGEQSYPQRRTPVAGNLSQRPLSMAPQRHSAIEVDESAADAAFTKPKINVYAYSNRDDADRFVIISNRKYREGDRIEEGGATVKRIEEHAMTLEYQGQTYKVPRP